MIFKICYLKQLLHSAQWKSQPTDGAFVCPITKVSLNDHLIYHRGEPKKVCWMCASIR